MIKNNEVYLTFSDVQIVPMYSEIESRDDVSLETQLTKNYRLETPFVASPMPDVCETKMAIAMWELGGVGIIHRFMTIDEQVNMVKHMWVYTNAWHSENPIELHFANPVIAAAIGVTGDYFNRARALVDAGHANVLMLDVAHGHHRNVKLAMHKLLSLKGEFQFDIIAGTIATPEAAGALIDWGADALRVGVGGGSACETRIRTGVGIPQLQAILNIHTSDIVNARSVPYANIPILSDGGIRYPGDVAKALIAGASTTMMGHLFAGTDESPGIELITGQFPDTKIKRVYKGAASASQKLNYNGAANYIEGATKIIDARGPVSNVFGGLEDGLRSSLSYVGAATISGFKAKGKLIQITQAGMVEAHPHMLFQQ